jgi:diguanylate cyclase (GGDEF)-like protein
MLCAARGGRPSDPSGEGMTSSLPAPNGNAAAQAARFRQFLVWVRRIALALAAFNALALWRHADRPIGWALGIATGFALVLTVALALVARQRLRPAAAVTCAGFLGVTFAGTLALPALTSTHAVLPLLAVVVALAFGGERPSWLLMLLAWIVAMAAAVAGEPAPGTSTPVFFAAFRLLTLAVTLALTLILLWQFSDRLSETLADTRAANLRLQEALAEVQMAEEKIKDLAYRDALTGLPNRIVFNDRLGNAVAQAERQSGRLAILFLDLDRFKVINDSLGHSLGDLLLQAVAGRLATCVRASDTVARLGGDEFTILLPGVHGAMEAARVAEKVLETLRQPFRLEGRELFVTGSMGVSLYPEDGIDADALVRNADVAMYRAKEQGRDGHRLYSPLMNDRALEQLALENALRRALARDELLLHYQPVVEIATGRIRSVEALVRWNHPERGMMWPSDFVPVAEVTGLIVPIGWWILRTACAQARAWHEQGLSDLRVAVNLSARQFQQADLVGQVEKAVAETGLSARYLELEITETDTMQSTEATLSTFRQLKALGVAISIDDFGIGYSSLGYLRRLPIDTLKIDQSFVRDIGTDPDDAAIVSAVIAMAHTLKLQVVAEGVDGEDQLDFLRRHGCDLMQGYLFGPPASGGECGEAMLRHAAGFPERREASPARSDTGLRS